MLKKKKEERLEQVKKDSVQAVSGEGVSAPAEQGEAAAQTAAESPEAPVRDMIPYLVFLSRCNRRGVPAVGRPAETMGGASVCVPPGRQHTPPADPQPEGVLHGARVRTQQGPSVFERWGFGSCQAVQTCSRAARIVQQHAMRVYLDAEYCPPALSDRNVAEEAGNAFAVDDRDVGEQVPYSDEHFMEELKGLDLFDSIRASPPVPTGEAVAVLGATIPWDCGEHPALDKGHNDVSQTMHKEARQCCADQLPTQ